MEKSINEHLSDLLEDHLIKKQKKLVEEFRDQFREQKRA